MAGKKSRRSTENNESSSRRGVLKAAAIGAVVLATPIVLIKQFSAGVKNYNGNYRNNPAGSPTVTFGFNIPQSGAYIDEGADELRAYQLAVKHINGQGDGGMLSTMDPTALQGNGVLGKRVEYVTGDTQTNAAAARASAKRMIEDGAVMITGGSSSGVAIATQYLCQEAGVVFMAGLTHSNDTTGKDKQRNGFRHFFNAYMSGAALGPVLEKEYGRERSAYHLSADYTWGWTTEASMRGSTEAIGWNTVDTMKTPVGTKDYSIFIEPILNSGADTLILNHYGRDMVNSLAQSIQFGLRDKQVNGKNFEIIVPLYSRLMAQGAGENAKGILGSTNWHWSLNDNGSQVFLKSFVDEYGFPPSQAAHTCYVQTLLYADACERAGTFQPAGVVDQLEGHTFDGMGNGLTEYRAADHQCFKDVVVVKGKDNPSSEFDLLEVVEITPRAQVEYPPEHRMFRAGELGPVNDGV